MFTDSYRYYMADLIIINSANSLMSFEDDEAKNIKLSSYHYTLKMKYCPSPPNQIKPKKKSMVLSGWSISSWSNKCHFFFLVMFRC